MTALLTDNLPLLAGTPNGIKKLRELILELAVRGKLVPQDPSNEPASELLKRIAEEKARLVAEGKIKKQKPLTERDEEAPAFELPAGWAWARLSDVVNVLNGRAYKKEELLDAGTPVLRVGNLFTSNHWYYSNLTLEENKYCNPGDLLFAWSASFGPFIWQGERSIYHYHIWKLDFYAQGQLSKHYLYNFLLEQTQEIKAAGHGVSMVHMTKEKMEKLIVPVPPFAEQHRIVAKVDELMALCDRLEAQQADAESAHAQLLQALLDSLTQASDADEFASNWQRLAEHFHTLFTTESSIDALKQTLLQLAVMGKLVPQDPSDEPAGELLKRIAEEKAQLVTEGKIKKQKPPAKITEDEKLFELATGWEWSRLGDLVIESGAGWSPSCEPRPREGNDWGVLKVSAVSWGVYRPEENKTLPASLDARPEHEVAEGDFLISRANTAELVARSVVVDATPSHLMLSDKIVRLKLSNLCNRHYANLANSTTHARQYYARVAGGTSSSMKNVSREQILSLPTALPPLAEQHRIVAKVDQLMSLCDQLKSRLTQANQLNEQLARALVEQAVQADPKAASTIVGRKTARTLLAAEIVHQLHSEKRMGKVKLQKALSLAEHVAQLEEIQSEEARFAAGPHDPALMQEIIEGLQANQWFSEQAADEGKRYVYRPLPRAGSHRSSYDALWSAAQRQRVSKLIDIMRSWDTARCERVSTLYSAWNDLLIEGREVSDTAILEEVMYNWNDSKLLYSEAEWLKELTDMKKHDLLVPTGFGKRTKGGTRSLPGI